MRSRGVGMLLVVGGLGLACSETNVAEADLVGTWNATAFEFSDFGDPVTDFDVLLNGGSVTMVIRADGTFTISMAVGAFEPDVIDGTWELQDGNTLVITEDGEVDGVTLEIELSGTTLTVYSDDIQFDFGDGEIPAQLDATFVRQ
jgi:hypothetical protein